MNECPESADPVRQKSGILVVRRHDDAVSFKGPEILGQRERNSGTAFGVGRVGHGILLQLWNVGDTRILDAPKLLGIFIWIGHQGWRWIDLPPSTPFTERAAQRCERPRRSSTRQSNSVEPSASRVAPGIEYAINPIRPIFAGQESDWRDADEEASR